METLLKGNLTRKEHLAKATQIVTSQLEEGDELYVAIRTIKMEAIKINKVTIAQQMAEKAYDAGKVNMEQRSLQSSSNIGKYFWNRKPVNYHHATNGITKSN
jgi:hypothetical protein